jgi:hypothetical protein
MRRVRPEADSPAGGILLRCLGNPRYVESQDENRAGRESGENPAGGGRFSGLGEIGQNHSRIWMFEGSERVR